MLAKLKILLLAGFGWSIAANSQAAPDNSGALWRVEQICGVNQATFGLAFPCLEVNLSSGFVVLRPPYGKSDTILSPIVKSYGVEDPSLHLPGAINYFDLAWKARHHLAGKTSKKLAFDDVGLAINSSRTRSQDQMHIHIDCIAADVKQALRQLEPGVPATGWFRLKSQIRQLPFWVYRVQGDSLASVNPFALVAKDLPGAKNQMGLMTIVAVGSQFKGGGRGFLVLAANTNNPANQRQMTGEDLLDHSCAP